MKVPKYLYEPIHGYNCYGIDLVRKCLELEAREYRNAGRADAASALRNTASALKRMVKNRLSPAAAFDWPPHGMDMDEPSETEGASDV